MLQPSLLQKAQLKLLVMRAGLIGWVPNTDTLHALIREYRDARKTPLNVEHRLMLGMSPDYDHLPLIHKVEVFQHALDSTDGEWCPRSSACCLTCRCLCVLEHRL